jgi:hypothetical protein
MVCLPACWEKGPGELTLYTILTSTAPLSTVMLIPSPRSSITNYRSASYSRYVSTHANQTTIIMLTALLILPLFGALLLCTMSGSTPTEESRVKNVALVTSLATFILSIIM